MKYFKSILARLICLFVLAFVSYSRADDVVGVVRIDANTNGLVEVEMPFEPMGNTGPSGFVAGLFTGDGSLFSDLLFCRSAASGVLTNAIWNGFNWLDPTTSFLSSMSVRAGDTLYFLRSDEEPFSFSLFGRHPAFLQSQELPRFSSICVDPTNETVALSVLSENCVYDVFSCDLTNVSSSTYYPWMHIARRFSPLAQTELADSLPIIGYARFYSVSDAALDADGDGISDALETFVYKTNPHLSDSDGDGIPDGCEIAWGTNPLFVENASPFCWAEGFERPDVVPGDVDGQNGWRASGGISPKVVEEFSFEGAASLALLGGADSKSKVVRDVELDSEVVWVDMRGYSLAILDMEEMSDSVAVFGCDGNGRLLALDGDLLRTDAPVKIYDSDWVRITLCINYRTRKWDLYTNGMLAYSQLGLRGNAERLNQIELEGGGSFVDNISITTTRPKGLSSDGDDMPDEWELSAFGTLERDGSGDFDLDGLSDADEAAHNTDPLNSDTDGDSIFDSWEVANALDPLDGSDATLDPDGDGMSNLLESQLGSNPAFYEPDPRLMTAGLYVEFFQTSAAQSGIPDFNWLNPIGAIVAETIDWREGSWPECAALRGDYFACRAAGYVCIPKSGEYVFYVDSDDGMCLYVDGQCVVSDAAPHASREVSGKVMLEAGWRPIELHYYENTSAAKLVLSWSGPKFAKAVIPSSSFCHVPPAEKPPRGFAFGLEASLYPFQNALTAMPDFSSLTPDCKVVASSIAYSSTAEPWAGMPETMADRFAALFEGFLIAEEAGRYDIALNSDDGSRLYIDGKLVIDNGGNHSMRKMLATVALSEGLHSLRLEYYENTDHAGLELSWAPTGGALVPVQPHSLCRQVANIDSDSDGLPDWWEEKYGFDFLSPVDATLDPDNDGLDNLGEFAAGSNPHLPDTDSDGMPDAWEAKNGTLPFIVDTLEDPDSDGLVNAEEYRLKTNPNLADTDGDGCSDKTEVANTRGNPLVADIVWSPVNVGEKFSGASFVSSTGTWRTDDSGAVFAAERAGSLTWRLTVPEGGADALALSVGQHNLYAKIFTFDLSLKVDGVFVTRELVSAQYGEKGEVYFFLPEIPHGEYEFTITWHNWEVNTFLSVYDLRFVKFNGIDSDFDGVADWKEHRASTSSAMDALPCESLVSPLCIEGRDIWRDVLEINVDYPESNAVFTAVKTIGDGFYADIPLPLDGSAIVSMKDRTLSDSFPVVWKSFDVFTEEYATNALLIRAGDSLKIAPHEDGESEITISISDGENSWLALTNWTESSSMPYCFETNGLYLVEVSRRGIFSSRTGYALVDAVSSRFPMRNPAILMDMPQKLSCPDLSPRNILEHDSELKLDAEIRTKGVELSLLTSADRDLGMVSRLAEGGPISDAVQVTPIWADNGTYYRVAENYADGSQLIVVSLLFGAVAENMTIELEIFVSGVTFEDGSRFKTLTAKDLDENGHYTIRFIRARGVTTSVCHRTYIYQDGKLIYTNK